MYICNIDMLLRNLGQKIKWEKDDGKKTARIYNQLTKGEAVLTLILYKCRFVSKFGLNDYCALNMTILIIPEMLFI